MTVRIIIISNATTINAGTFIDCSQLKSMTFEAGSKLAMIDYYAFA